MSLQDGIESVARVSRACALKPHYQMSARADLTLIYHMVDWKKEASENGKAVIIGPNAMLLSR